MRRGIAWFAACGLVVTACSSSGSGGRPNPVDLIKKAAGCALDIGGPSGSPGIGNDFLVATCNYPTQESLTVKTFDSDKARDADIDAGGNSDGIVVGPKWLVYINAAYQTPLEVTAEGLAKQLGGTAR